MSRVRRRLRWVGSGLLILVLIAFIDYWCFPYGGKVPGRPEPGSDNGLWLRYKWYFGDYGKAEITSLGRRLEQDRIGYAYFHVRNIDRYGKLVHRRAPTARVLNDSMERAAPSVQRIAWIFAGNRAADGLVDWSRRDVRRAMVAEAVWLVRDCGFDGVQWDCEIAPRRDPGLIALIEETRAALGKGPFIGFAAPMWLPAFGLGWDDGSFRDIAKVCDQIAVMAYDTGAYFPRAYSSLVAAQRDRIGQALSGTRCRLIVGVPTYGPGLPSHNTRAENLANALRGVRMGKAPIEGVALFADYTTDRSEWNTYRTVWLGRR